MDKIVIKDLQKSYTTRKKETTVALYNCSLDVKQGEFLVLLGESGCGKSSLLKVIAGIESYDFGEIYFDGVNAEEVRQIDKNMSYVSQNIVLFPHRTVYENIMEPLDILRYSKEDKINRVNELSDLLNLKILLTRRPRELSGGQQQKVAIARALAKEPAVCLFDEPLSALDPIYHDEIIELLKHIHIKTNATYIYSTHNQNEAFRLADRVALLHNRKVEQVGTPKELFTKPKTLFVVDFLASVYLFRTPMHYKDGKFTNEDYDINIEYSLDNKYKEKIDDKDVVVAFTINNIIVNKNGKNHAKVIQNLSNGVKIDFASQELFIPIEDYNEQLTEIVFDITMDNCPIFIDGENIFYEGV